MPSTFLENSSVLEKENVPLGKKIRLVVRSAEEAVRVIREKLGPNAQVLSVRQLEGEGLSRLLKSPKLEVIAILPDSSSAFQASSFIDQPVPSSKALKSVYKNNSLDSIKTGSLEDMLHRVGFDEGFVSDLSCMSIFEEWKKEPLQLALAHMGQFLIERYKKIPSRPITSRVAIFGTPGVGVTTALCKLMAREVFWSSKKVQVLKLDGDVPNSDEALNVFCDVLGARLYRDPVDVPHLDKDIQLFLDVPGFSFLDPHWDGTRRRLDELNITTRVLSMHAGYDANLLKKTYELGTRLGATHFLFTHTDEADEATKLWRFILRSTLTPLGLSHGQSITGDYTPEILPWLLEKTFPASLIDVER